jgi:imidazole glycerol-phosphate synthase subunit HisH
VTILDYGAGNLHSLEKVLAMPDTTVRIESDPARCVATDVLVLPGVGAFSQAAACIAPARGALRDAISAGLPTIGICLGMQLFMERSEEGGGREVGLALVAGEVTRLRSERVPQMGWNSLDDVRDALIQRAGLDVAYYANSFVCRPDDVAVVGAWSTHEQDRFAASIRVPGMRALGVQFHPEKSSTAGVQFLRSAVRELAA